MQFPDDPEPPTKCPICTDERQYVRHGGQRWTTVAELRRSHRNEIRDDHGLTGIGTEPRFAIGQRALVVPGREGNVMWDCITLLDDETVEKVRALGGLRAIAISHPHYYSSLGDWSRAFGAPVYLHEDDARWVMRRDADIVYWRGETLDLGGGVTLVRCGGHFAGGTVLHWEDKLLSGDIVYVVRDRRWVSFMYSYPNLIPLDAASVRRVVAALEPFDFDRIWGAWWGDVSAPGAKESVRRSADRYVEAINGTLWMRGLPVAPDYHVPRAWSELRLQPLKLPPAAEPALARFRALYWNGEVTCLGFQADEDAYDDLISGRNLRVEHRSVLEDFLRSPELEQAGARWTEVAIAEAVFARTMGFALAGEFGQALRLGGAYTPKEVEPTDARHLGWQLADALIGDAVDVPVYVTSGSEIVERTWIVLDHERRRLWLISLLDYD